MFWGVETSLFIPAILLIGSTWVMFLFHAILYFQYRERIIWKYCFYLGTISIYLALDLYGRSNSELLSKFQQDTLATAVNFIVILGYASFMLQAVIEFKPGFPKIFRIWSFVYYYTIGFSLLQLVASFFNWSSLDLTFIILSNTLRALFVAIGIVAIVQFYPLIKGRFMNLVKWGGIVYFLFMVMVLIAMAVPGHEILGLSPMHYTYLGTFADVLIFSYAMSIKIKESLKKAAQVRQDLSRDLHDEVGATLTGIRVFGQLAKDRPETLQANLEKINTYSEEMLNKMSDIVWALNPDNDSIDRMISKLHSYTASVTSAKDIQLEFRVEDSIRKKNMDMELRKNVFLLAKEAITNAVKYSNCKRIQLALTTDATTGKLRITDDGIGFDKFNIKDGNGLRNMENRAAEAKGQLQIDTGPGKGTAIELVFSFT